MDFVEEMLRLFRSLNKHGVEYIVIGGGAMNILGLVRATEDIDFFIRPNADNVEKLKAALREVWDDPHIDEISAADLCGDYPSVRYGPPEGTLYIDILTRLGEFAGYDDLEWREVMLRDVPVRTATPRTLHWLKRGTVRAVDKADAQALKDVFDFENKED